MLECRDLAEGVQAQVVRVLRLATQDVDRFEPILCALLLEREPDCSDVGAVNQDRGSRVWSWGLLLSAVDLRRANDWVINERP